MIRKESSSNLIRSLSGLVNYQGLVVGVSDEFHGLYIRSSNSERFHSFSHESAALSYKDRKRIKPDQESLSIYQFRQNDYIMAFPSLSKSNRIQLGIFSIQFSSGDLQVGSQRVVLLENLLRKLSENRDQLNIEGHLIEGNKLFLLNRGNSISPNEIIEVASADQWAQLVLTKLSDSEFNYSILRKPVDLGSYQGFELQWTDGIVVDSAKMLFLATVEKTDNAVDDGEVLASFIGYYDLEKHQVLKVQKLLDEKKAEGICTFRDRYLVCIDSDSEKMENEFYSFPRTFLD